MQTIQAEITVSDDRRLEIDLPEDIEVGTYQVVLVLNPQPQPLETVATHQLNEATGKLEIFSQIDPVQWQQNMREEWDETRLSH